jgi:hypothetical protein
MDPVSTGETVAGLDGGYAASILWDTQTRPIQRPNTNDTPCWA